MVQYFPRPLVIAHITGNAYTVPYIPLMTCTIALIIVGSGSQGKSVCIFHMNNLQQSPAYFLLPFLSALRMTHGEHANLNV